MLFILLVTHDHANMELIPFSIVYQVQSLQVYLTSIKTLLEPNSNEETWGTERHASSTRAGTASGQPANLPCVTLVMYLVIWGFKSHFLD
jgi:hypothetical protein